MANALGVGLTPVNRYVTPPFIRAGRGVASLALLQWNIASPPLRSPDIRSFIVVSSPVNKLENFFKVHPSDGSDRLF